jgi:copper transport protein
MNDENRTERYPRTNQAVTMLLAVGLVLTTTAAGHGGVSGWFTFLADAVHVAAAAAWTGGLLFLVIAVASTPATERWPFAARAVPRFSALALGSVALLLVAGVVNAYLEVRVWRGLWETTYGQLVLVKAALVLPLLALGAFNNRVSVPRLRAAVASAVEQRRFLRAVAAELVVLVAVVAVTAVLVDEAPAKDTLPQPRSQTAHATIGPFKGTVVVTPAAVGSNRITLRFESAGGAPASLAEVDVAASLPARGIGPLRLTTRRTAPGTYTASAAIFAIAGEWRLRLTVRRGAFDEWLKTIDITIRKGLAQ